MDDMIIWEKGRGEREEKGKKRKKKKFHFITAIHTERAY